MNLLDEEDENALVNVAPALHGYDSETKRVRKQKNRGDTTINPSGTQQFNSAAKGRRGVRRCQAGRRRGVDEKKRDGAYPPPSYLLLEEIGLRGARLFLSFTNTIQQFAFKQRTGRK